MWSVGACDELVTVCGLHALGLEHHLRSHSRASQVGAQAGAWLALLMLCVFL
jgi:hypothetical protein